MKVIISYDKKTGKQTNKYKSADGLVFDVKEHCIFYENKWMRKEFVDEQRKVLK